MLVSSEVAARIRSQQASLLARLAELLDKTPPGPASNAVGALEAELHTHVALVEAVLEAVAEESIPPPDTRPQRAGA